MALRFVTFYCHSVKCRGKNAKNPILPLFLQNWTHLLHAAHPNIGLFARLHQHQINILSIPIIATFSCFFPLGAKFGLILIQSHPYDHSFFSTMNNQNSLWLLTMKNSLKSMILMTKYGSQVEFNGSRPITPGVYTTHWTCQYTIHACKLHPCQWLAPISRYVDSSFFFFGSFCARTFCTWGSLSHLVSLHLYVMWFCLSHCLIYSYPGSSRCHQNAPFFLGGLTTSSKIPSPLLRRQFSPHISPVSPPLYSFHPLHHHTTHISSLQHLI